MATEIERKFLVRDDSFERVPEYPVCVFCCAILGIERVQAMV